MRTALAQAYAGEAQYGAYPFLGDQRSEVFGRLFATLTDRLKAAFGEPRADGQRNIMRGDGGKEAAWRMGKADLVLSWWSSSGDGDFEHQILLAALRDLK